MRQEEQNLREAFKSSLELLLDRHGVPASNSGRTNAFALLVGRSRSTAGRWLSGKDIPPIETLISLCGILSCSMDELLGLCPIKRDTVDLDHTISAKYFSENGTVEVQIPTLFLPIIDQSVSLGMVRVRTTEMAGYANPDDRVFFNLNETELKSGSVYVLRIANKLAIRRFRQRLDGQVDVLCESAQYPVETIAPSRLVPADHASETDIGILGRVIAKINFDNN